MSIVGFGNQYQGYDPNKLLGDSRFVHDQQKRALDQLVDKQYNKIHEDAFAKIVHQRKASKPASERARGIIWALWKERTRFKDIIKTQDFEYAKLIKENEELRAELAALKKTKGDYGQA